MKLSVASPKVNQPTALAFVECDGALRTIDTKSKIGRHTLSEQLFTAGIKRFLVQQLIKSF
jgi:hypothetical protein